MAAHNSNVHITYDKETNDNVWNHICGCKHKVTTRSFKICILIRQLAIVCILPGNGLKCAWPSPRRAYLRIEYNIILYWIVVLQVVLNSPKFGAINIIYFILLTWNNSVTDLKNVWKLWTSSNPARILTCLNNDIPKMAKIKMVNIWIKNRASISGKAITSVDIRTRIPLAPSMERNTPRNFAKRTWDE